MKNATTNDHTAKGPIIHTNEFYLRGRYQSVPYNIISVPLKLYRSETKEYKRYNIVLTFSFLNFISANRWIFPTYTLT